MRNQVGGAMELVEGCNGIGGRDYTTSRNFHNISKRISRPRISTHWSFPRSQVIKLLDLDIILPRRR